MRVHNGGLNDDHSYGVCGGDTGGFLRLLHGVDVFDGYGEAAGG